MKKLMHLGKSLSKAEQKQIFGGDGHKFTRNDDTGGGNGGGSSTPPAGDCETNLDCLNMPYWVADDSYPTGGYSTLRDGVCVPFPNSTASYCQVV